MVVLSSFAQAAAQSWTAEPISAGWCEAPAVYAEWVQGIHMGTFLLPGAYLPGRDPAAPLGCRLKCSTADGDPANGVYGLRGGWSGYSYVFPYQLPIEASINQFRNCAVVALTSDYGPSSQDREYFDVYVEGSPPWGDVWVGQTYEINEGSSVCSRNVNPPVVNTFAPLFLPVKCDGAIKFMAPQDSDSFTFSSYVLACDLDNSCYVDTDCCGYPDYLCINNVCQPDCDYMAFQETSVEPGESVWAQVYPDDEDAEYRICDDNGCNNASGFEEYCMNPPAEFTGSGGFIEAPTEAGSYTYYACPGNCPAVLDVTTTSTTTSSTTTSTTSSSTSSTSTTSTSTTSTSTSSTSTTTTLICEDGVELFNALTEVWDLYCCGVDDWVCPEDFQAGPGAERVNCTRPDPDCLDDCTIHLDWVTADITHESCNVTLPDDNPGGPQYTTCVRDSDYDGQITIDDQQCRKLDMKVIDLRTIIHNIVQIPDSER